jgi:hypothetical protein
MPDQQVRVRRGGQLREKRGEVELTDLAGSTRARRERREGGIARFAECHARIIGADFLAGRTGRLQTPPVSTSVSGATAVSVSVARGPGRGRHWRQPGFAPFSILVPARRASSHTPSAREGAAAFG